ncbi:MAG: VWA domain-containing protein [Microcystis aeruginosa G13-07]|nr:VWA domain-containing protein [Microcystis aeruginosa G13-07]
MKFPRLLVKSAVLVAVAMTTVTLGEKNSQAQALEVESTSTVLLSDSSTTAISLRQQSLTHQGVLQAIRPLNHSPSAVVAVISAGTMTAIVLIGGVIIIVGGAIAIAGRVVIGQNEVGIVIKKFTLLPSAPRLPANRQFALKGEAGIQAKTLQHGQYWGYWPWMYDILKVSVIHISHEEIGLVEAKDGESLALGQNFGKVVDCDNFQDERAFFEQGGQKGRQQGILTAGTYRINTKLFNIRKDSLTQISSEEIGLVEAKDGKPLPPERSFGRVTNCQDFQNPKAFFDQGGQAGKQLAILTTGTYQINTELFKIRKVPVIHISPEEIGLVEAKDGETLPSGQTFARVVDCDNFQNVSEFFRKGGQKGKQLAILMNATYRINTDLFKVSKVPVTKIPTGHIGLVEAKDGKSLPPGHTFGKIVDCNDFENGEAFLKNGGQTGKQLGYLRAGTYYINTELFHIHPVPVTNINSEEIGLVEAKDGVPRPPGQNFGKIVKCDKFQNGQTFLENGGQSGKQLAILTAGTYQINTELFNISKVPVTKISQDEIGLVEAKDGKPLQLGQTFGKVVECDNFQDAEAFLKNGGQMGKQLAILKTGTYQINTELFNIRKVPVIHIFPGEIGLVEAKEGATIPRERTLAKVVECDNFQDAEAFLQNGGQKGKQIAILTTGNYYINTDFFTVITVANAVEHGMKPEDLRVYKLDDDHVGIVTTLDGIPLPDGEIAAPILEGHEKFQDGQKFIEAGGYRGLQQEVLTEGEWNLNPWFVKVEQVPQTEIRSDEVGVIVSYVGKNSDLDNQEELNDDNHQSEYFYKLVEPGYRGVERIPLTAGKYPINTRIKRVEKVPTTEIVLKWTNESKPPSNYDANLQALKLRSDDKYIFDVELTQVICIAAKNAPKMICRIGSQEVEESNSPIKNSSGTAQKYAQKYAAIKNLVTRVLASVVSSHFQDSALKYKALEFADSHSERQKEAGIYIKNALNNYGVESRGTFITEIDLPKHLEESIQKLTEEELKRGVSQQEQLTEIENRKLVEEQEKTKTQAQKIAGERNIEIAKLAAEEHLTRAKAQADAEQLTIETLGKRLDIETEQKERLAQIEINAFSQRIKDISPELYAQIEESKSWAEALGKLKITYPQYFSVGGDSSSGGMDALSQLTNIEMFKLLREGLGGQQGARQLPASQAPEQIGGASIEQESLPAQATELRCPVVLILDTSSELSSECLNELIKGIATFRRDIEQDNTASRCIEVAVISTGGSAQVIQDFTTVNKFSTPSLITSGTTAMGQGIELALNKVENRQSIGENQGIQFYRPWIFLITASTPTDSWQNAARRISQAVENHKLNFFVVGIQGVDMNILSQITHRSTPPFMLDGWKFQELFHWLADALKKVSLSEVGGNVRFSPISSWASTDGVFRQ